ncbi:MAG: hypothetical protein GXO48_00185 [Chlorobi bacterium]|nr:hypothetical protein [Chlorobiota bacterium]
MANKYSLAWLLSALFKHWKILFATGIISIALGIGVTLLVPPIYESSTVIYAGDVRYFGYAYVLPDAHDVNALPRPIGKAEDQARIKYIASSGAVLSNVVQELNLIKHYEIDTTEPGALDKAIKKLKKRIDIHQEREGGVYVGARDEDPQMAAKIVRSIVKHTDRIFGNTLRAGWQRWLNSLKQQMKEAQAKGDTLLAKELYYKTTELSAFVNSDFPAIYVLAEPYIPEKPESILIKTVALSFIISITLVSMVIIAKEWFSA